MSNAQMRFIDIGPSVVVVRQNDTLTTAAAFEFDPHELRDHDGKWTKNPGKELIDDLKKAVKAVTPAVIYKKHDHGKVVAHSSDGNKRMSWHAEKKKFVVEKQKDGKWTEESALTKTAAYEDMKKPDKWFEPGQTGTQHEPSSPSLKPEHAPAPVEPTVKTEPKASDVPKQPEAPKIEESTPAPAPEIPKQADAPKIETDTPKIEADTPGVYTGPTIENYGGAPKDVTDKVRQAYVAQIAHEHRVEALAEELRKDKSKYEGWNAWDKSMNDARAQLAGDAPPDSDLENALNALETALPDYTVRDNIRRRLNLEAGVEVRAAKFVKKNGLGELTPEVKDDLTQRMKEAFAGKKVAIRVSPKTVEHILNDGRVKSQFESNKSNGKKDFDMRASVERLLFGINDKPWQNVEKRPIYGYVAMDGIRPAGIGSAELGSPSTDALSQYGQVQVVLKDSVRDRTTAMFGDSLNNMQEAIPTPINEPDWRSFQASTGGITGKGLEGLDRSGESQDFRAGAYAEAQIHGGVGVNDIEEVVFPTTPNATLKKQLEDAGIPYRVLTFKTAADGSDEERANVLRIAKQDKPAIEGEIKKLQDKLADPKYVGDDYHKKDLAKYEKQLKTINDALPLLEGTKTSPAKKVVKATAPKQADASKIETPAKPTSKGAGQGKDLQDQFDAAITGGDSKFISDMAAAQAKPKKPVDHVLVEIAKRQGFDAKPKLVSKAEMDKLVKEPDANVAYRGVKDFQSWMAAIHGVHDIPDKSAVDIVNDTKKGDYAPGLGVYGNGYYFSVSKKTADFFSGVGPGYTSATKPGIVMRAVLSPDAKTITYQELIAMMAKDANRPSAHMLRDPGAYAAAKGYDAITVTRGHSGDGSTAEVKKNHPKIINVLNRGALIMEEQ